MTAISKAPTAISQGSNQIEGIALLSLIVGHFICYGNLCNPSYRKSFDIDLLTTIFLKCVSRHWGLDQDSIQLRVYGRDRDRSSALLRATLFYRFVFSNQSDCCAFLSWGA